MNNTEPKELRRGVVIFLYIIILFCYMFCHIDNGILAVSNEVIKDDLKITESYVGLLTSGLYLGNVVGSIISPVLFAKFRAKHIMVTAALMNAASVIVFSFVKIYWVIFASRVLAGFFQVAFVIYSPVWIDLCAPPEK